MKKLALLLAFFAVSIVSNAQVWLGGSLGISYQTADDISMTEVGIAPMLRYDLNEKFSIGLELAEDYASGEGEKINTLSISPFVRYNCCHIGKGKFFLQGQVGYGVMNFTDYDVNAKTIAVGVLPGFSFPISEKAQFEVSLGGLSWANVKMWGESSSTFRFDALSNISVGFAFKI